MFVAYMKDISRLIAGTDGPPRDPSRVDVFENVQSCVLQ